MRTGSKVKPVDFLRGLVETEAKDSSGKTVALYGTFSRQELSKEQAEHLASDLGEAKPTGHTPFEYHIVATSVSIPKT